MKKLIFVTLVSIGITVTGYVEGFGSQNTPTYADFSTQPPLQQSSVPMPYLKKGHPVEWWFVFKFNAATFSGCGGSCPQRGCVSGGSGAQRVCISGGTVQNYEEGYSQQYVYASSEDSVLQKGTGCIGDTLTDPVGATFEQVYKGLYY